MTKRHTQALRQRLAEARLYLLVGRPENSVSEWCETILEAVAGGVDAVQLRIKDAATGEVVARLSAVRERLRAARVLAIVNDDVAAALAGEADGVHLGQDDLAVAAARAALGPDRLIGLSTHDAAQIAAARDTSADYLGLGAMYESATKAVERRVTPEELPSLLAAADRPLFAIGGIDASNLPELIAAGVRRIAVSSAILRDPDPRRAAAALAAMLRAAPNA
jgi:thiamine-phosphate pyrophosphorylase